MEFVGRTLAKSFPGYGRKKFKGTVSGVTTDRGVQLFQIEYEDGDNEELELHELKRVLQPQGTAAGKRKAAEPDDAQAVATAAAVTKAAAAAATEAASAASAHDGSNAGRGSGSGKGRGPKGKPKAKAVPVRSLQTELPPNSVDEAHLKGMMEEVAANTKALEVDMVRHLPTSSQPAEEPRCARAVTCGSICYISTLSPSTGRLVGEDAAAEELSEEYEDQVNNVLEQLGSVLQDVGSSRDHLLCLSVLLKDVVAGRQAFAAAWNNWCNHRALPALTVQESYLGTEEILVAVSATAAVPKHRYT